MRFRCRRDSYVGLYRNDLRSTIVATHFECTDGPATLGFPGRVFLRYKKASELIDPAIWKDNSKAENAIRVVKKLQNEGFTAYLAGGCVRDALLGQTPKDFDVATDAIPERVREIFGKRRTLAFGASFGVIAVIPDSPKANRAAVDRSPPAGRVVSADREPTEVATFRSDGTYSDGRRPDEVHFGTPEADAQRRDFTINGMFLDPLSGQIIDYVNGQTDLKRRRLQTIGRAVDRFDEDKLRMLRAVRFATTLGFDVAPDTIAAIKAFASEITVVSGERIGVEMRKTLASANAIEGLRLLRSTGLEQHVWPGLGQLSLDDAEQQLASRDALTQPHLPTPLSAAALAIGCILRLLPDSETQLSDLRKSWKLSGEESRAIGASLKLADSLRRADELPWSKLQPILVNRDIGTAIRVAACSETSTDNQSRGLDRCVRELGRSPEDLNPIPLLNGSDLAELGHTPGPQFSRLLKELRVQQLDGQISDRDSAVKWLAQQ